MPRMQYSVLFVVAAIVLVSYSLGCSTDEEREGSRLPPEEEAMLDRPENVEKLLEIAAKDREVGSFVTENPEYHYAITVLQRENITLLSQEYPVIYGNLPNKTLYQIEYNNGKGILVIVDLEDEAVVRYFRTTGVSLE